MQTSHEWVQYFEQNLKKQRIDWDRKPQITAKEKKEILYALKAWQKGETSDGSHLKKAAAKYAGQIDDPEYVQAVDLFIIEEQKHGANLGRYIDLIGEERLKFDFGDYLFRQVRYFNTNIEIWTITVLIVESAAQIFYQALKDATKCTLLQEICTDILIDEAEHIRFQKERVMQIMSAKSFLKFHLSLAAYFLFFSLTCRVIWLAHSRAFKAGGVNREKYLNLMHHKFQRALNFNLKQSKESVAVRS